MKKTTLKSLQNEIKDDVGTLVIDQYNVVKLAGVVYHDDYYYEFLGFHSTTSGQKFGKYYVTICAGYIPLKRSLPEEDYDILLKRYNHSEEFCRKFFKKPSAWRMFKCMIGIHKYKNIASTKKSIVKPGSEHQGKAAYIGVNIVEKKNIKEWEFSYNY